MRDQRERADTEGEVQMGTTHERMVVDALTKRHGNSVTMLRLLRDGPVNCGRRSRAGNEKSVL